MSMQRLRAFLVTIALVLGAGTMSAVAAPLLRGDDVVTVATEAPTDGATETTGEATEDPTEPVADPTENSAEPEDHEPAVDRRSKQDTTAQERAERQAAKAQRDAAKAERKASKPAHARGHGNSKGKGKGSGHGKAVSDAARGVTPPVGDCRNHGHWVSTVAKGKSSCDDNPRPPAGSDD